MDNIITICGGGSTYTLPMLKTLCDYHNEFPIAEVRLFDIETKKMEYIYEAAKVMFYELMPDVKLKMTTDKEEAFASVDFVFMQIRSGGFEMREHDEKVPLSYGCVGQETCGAGGFAYGLRSIRDIIDLVQAIRKLSPNAWILNYSNPAAIVAEATQRFFPDDQRLINICDMPIAIMDGFAERLGLKRNQLKARYFGLNHFGWFTNIYDMNGNDRLDEIRAGLREARVMPEELSQDSGWQETFEMLHQMVSDFDAFIPNTYLQYYLYPKSVVKKENPKYTRANYVMDHRLKDVERLCQQIIKNKTVQGSSLEKGVHGTYIVELAKALTGSEEKEFLLIVKNHGIISNFSKEAMIEVPCIVSSRGIEPLFVGEIPTFQKALMEVQYGYEKLTVDAFINEDDQAAFQALTLNRTIGDATTARQILDALKIKNQGYWPNLK